MAVPAADPLPNPASDPAAQPAGGQYFETEPPAAAASSDGPRTADSTGQYFKTEPPAATASSDGPRTADSTGQYFKTEPPAATASSDGPRTADSTGQYFKTEPPAATASSDGPRTADSTGQYFETEPAVATAPRTVAVNVGGMQLAFVTDSGVFSPGRLDAGTRLLLLEAPPLDAGDRRVLDLGCGWGPIACVAGLRSPAAEVLAVDVNERALSLTAGNAERNRAGNVTVARPDEVDPAHRFDRILCNPPIRVGKSALRGLLGAWLDRLAAGGRAHLVVHRHLGSDSLARWLTDQGHPVDRLVSRSGYRLLEVRPRGGGDSRSDRPGVEAAGAP